MAAARPRPTPPVGANHVWAYDFVFDACADGEQLKCLTVVDEWTRECLAIYVAGSIRSARVIEVLARLVSVHGAPAFFRSDTRLGSVNSTQVCLNVVGRFRSEVVQREAGHEHIDTTLGYAKEVQNRGGRYGQPFPPLPESLVGPAGGPAGPSKAQVTGIEVGEAGFEPAISSTQSLRTTGLCYSPKRTGMS